jgi:general stress protein 26
LAPADPRFLTLAAAEATIRQKLARACRDRRAAWRTPVLATVGADGAPQARTLVLRGVDRESRRLQLHSDSRAGKVAAIGHEPRVALTFWCPRDRLQLRIAGLATVEASGDLVAEAWLRVPPVARRNYLTALPPGAPLDGGTPEVTTTRSAHFALIGISIQSMDWLWLGEPDHRRGLLAWDGNSWAARWLVP